MEPRKLTMEDIRSRIYDCVFDALCDEGAEFECFGINLYGETGTQEYYDNIEKKTAEVLDTIMKQ